MLFYCYHIIRISPSENSFPKICILRVLLASVGELSERARFSLFRVEKRNPKFDILSTNFLCVRLLLFLCCRKELFALQECIHEMRHRGTTREQAKNIKTIKNSPARDCAGE